MTENLKFKNFLEPLHCGALVLPGRFLPAPMEGVTNPAFSRVLLEFGLVDVLILPFFRVTTGVPSMKILRRWLLPFMELGCPVVAQVMGNDPKLLAGTAERLQALGVVGVDLNAACSSRTVVRHGAGGALLRETECLGACLEAMRSVLDIGLSVKLRCGYSSIDEFPCILRLAEATGVDLAFLHYRTVEENYAKMPQGERLKRFEIARATAPNLKIIGSGDFYGIADFNDFVELDGVLAARGLLRKPWLIQEMKAHCIDEKLVVDDVFNRNFFLRLVEEHIKDGATGTGYILQIAGWLFGCDSDFFSNIRCSLDLENLYDKIVK